MSFQNKYVFTQATKEDEKGIVSLFEQQSFEGGIGVQYLRGSAPMQSFFAEGNNVVSVVVKDSECENKIIGLGVCVVKKGYVSGKICNIGYLTGLKLLKEYQKKFTGIAKAYDFINEASDNKIDYFYSTILSDNIYVQKMLEKKRKTMPTYNFLCNYTSFMFKTGGKISLPKGYLIKECTKDFADEFYKNLSHKRDFSLQHPSQNILSTAQFYAFYKNGKPIAIASVVDLRTLKQYVVKKYSGIYNLIRHFPTNLFGYPNFPKLNETVSVCSAAFYFDIDINMDDLSHFIKSLFKICTETKIIMVGAVQDSALYNALKKEKCVKYQSRLYQTSFKKDDLIKNNNIADIEIAFL